MDFVLLCQGLRRSHIIVFFFGLGSCCAVMATIYFCALKKQPMVTHFILTFDTIFVMLPLYVKLVAGKFIQRFVGVIRTSVTQSFKLHFIQFLTVFLRTIYCSSMRSVFPCCVCGKKSANTGFVNPGICEQCICRPCYARQVRACLQTIGVHTETQTELTTGISEEGMCISLSFIFCICCSMCMQHVFQSLTFFTPTERISQSSSSYLTVSR